MTKPAAIRTYPLPTEASTAKAVILADGEYPAPDSIAGAILRSAQIVICCDGAADSFIAAGGIPAAIVGDCDSLGGATERLYGSIVHRVKDTETNDLTKALSFCLSQGLDDLIILGATGCREDHTLANISLLADYAAGEGSGRMAAHTSAERCTASDTADDTADGMAGGSIRVRMITDHGVFDAITCDSRFESFAGQQVSLFTIDHTVPVRSEGLLYPLPPVFRSWWCGSLNQSEGDAFTIYTSSKTIIFRAFENGR